MELASTLTPGPCSEGVLKMREWKMQEWNMQEWNMREQIAGVENAGAITSGNPPEEIP